MSRPKIVFISLYEPYSFGVCTLHRAVKNIGCEVNTIFFKTTTPTMRHERPSNEEFILLYDFIIAHNPDIVGISLRTTNFEIAKEITEGIKNICKSIIVWGGIHPTICPEQCIEYADVVCIGEGEKPFIDLVKTIEARDNYYRIRNLWVKDHNKNPLYSLNKDLDNFSPDLSNENKYLIHNNKIIQAPTDDRTSYAVMTSRGCFFSCSFCCNNVLHDLYKGDKHVRRRSVDSVIQELEWAKGYFKNLKDIRFIDDVFTFDQKWISEFCFKYTERINLPFHCLVHPKFTDEYTIYLLKNAGLVSVIMGIQSGSDSFRKEVYNRNESNAEVLEADKILSEYKINKYYDLLIGNPLESEKDKKQTLDLLLMLKRPFQLHTFTLTHFPKTRMTQALINAGKITENDIEDKKQNTWEGKFCPTLDERRDKDTLFWDNLFYLTHTQWIPKSLISKLYNWDYFRNNPEKFTKVLKMTSGNMYTVGDSKLDKLRMKAIIAYQNPEMIFKLSTWRRLLSKI